MAERSEPACGSVRFIVPVHSPATILGRKRCLSSSDAWCASASTAPMVSIWQSEKARLADFHISATALETSAGIPCPPMSGLAGIACQPASMNLR